MGAHEHKKIKPPPQQDPNANRFGFLVGSLRVKKEWSRAKLARQIMGILPQVVLDDDPLYDDVSESWLRHIESGKKRIVTHQMVEVLSQALECSEGERLSLLSAAGLGIFEVTDSIKEVILRIAALMNEDEDIRKLIELFLKDKKASTLSDTEIREILDEIIKLKIVDGD